MSGDVMSGDVMSGDAAVGMQQVGMIHCGDVMSGVRGEEFVGWWCAQRLSSEWLVAACLEMA